MPENPRKWTKYLSSWYEGEVTTAAIRANYSTISLISHQGKVMPRVILNRLKRPRKRRLDAELDGTQWDNSSTAESSLRNACNPQ
ncbi:hypothetical protein DPMN_091599 [Dreissena polymorpha]|uniref:Uncharacterized protein n=1 Tax=Dreissena polymorpha TaxID=45954 RepID=A0A9D4KZT9_DREPO|nr:hypothetical protein DPMN_091599 [Dreissena polymorpha]